MPPVRFTQWLQLYCPEAGHQPRAGKASSGRSRRCCSSCSRSFRFCSRIPARLLGVGIRPEHVHTPEASP